MIYFLQAGPDGRIKIGFTSGKTADARVDDLSVGCPYEPKLLTTMDGTLKDEGLLHEQFKDSRVNGEWFLPTVDLMEFIRAIKDSKPPVHILDIVDAAPSVKCSSECRATLTCLAEAVRKLRTELSAARFAEKTARQDTASIKKHLVEGVMRSLVGFSDPETCNEVAGRIFMFEQRIEEMRQELSNEAQKTLELKKTIWASDRSLKGFDATWKKAIVKPERYWEDPIV